MRIYIEALARTYDSENLSRLEGTRISFLLFSRVAWTGPDTFHT